MSPRPLLILSLEGFSPAAISCYGSSWNDTPTLDAIASGGCVFDRWMVAQDDPHQPLQQLFENSSQWLQPMAALGSVELITDVKDIAVAASAASSGFDQVTEVPFPESKTVQSDIDQTHLATLIAEVIDRDHALEGNWGVMWLHSSALTTRWDAPRRLFPIEELEDVEETSFPLIVDDARVPAIVPNAELRSEDWWQYLGESGEDPRKDPDFANAWMRTYGCQIRMFDFLVKVLQDALEQRNVRLVITGTSGFQLGQSGVIGSGIGPLRSPQLHVPMILSDLPATRMTGVKSDGALADVFSALASCDHTLFGPEAWDDSQSDQEGFQISSNRAGQAVILPSWYFVEDDDGSEHLYWKPDDINDYNDVANLRPDVIEELQKTGYLEDG